MPAEDKTRHSKSQDDGRLRSIHERPQICPTECYKSLARRDGEKASEKTTMQRTALPQFEQGPKQSHAGRPKTNLCPAMLASTETNRVSSIIMMAASRQTQRDRISDIIRVPTRAQE
eukprot:6173654-Pleurochrysis_carterae.AAC.4